MSTFSGSREALWGVTTSPAVLKSLSLGTLVVGRPIIGTETVFGHIALKWVEGLVCLPPERRRVPGGNHGDTISFWI